MKVNMLLVSISDLLSDSELKEWDLLIDFKTSPKLISFISSKV